VPTPTPTRTAYSCLFEADDLYWEGDLKEAIALYERAIELRPDPVEPYVALARLLVLEGQTVEAVERAEAATEKAPQNAQAWAVLGLAYDWHGEFEEAIRACERALQLAPDLAEAHAYLAEAYIDSGRWLEAVESAETALKLDKESVDVQRNYGYVMEAQGNYARAVEAYQSALAVHPNLALLHIAVGKNYQALERDDAALESFQRAVEVDPRSAEAYYRLGRAYYDRGEPDKARDYLKTATQVDPEFGPAFGYLAFTYWTRRNYEDAIPNLERAIMLESRAARRRARRFLLSVENRHGETNSPSSQVVMSGEFEPVSLERTDTFRAPLTPTASDVAWQGATGFVTLDTRTGVFTVTLEAMPATRPDHAYVGWIEGVRNLSGSPLHTEPLRLDEGRLADHFEATWVEGPRIDYFYTLGLAHFFLDECDKAYPLFEAALQIDPSDPNPRRGIQLCQDAESR
jgi:tetratricopeptide (TPR) repeat protein